MKRTIREIGGIITQEGIEYQKHSSIILFLEDIFKGENAKLLIEVIGDAALKVDSTLKVYQMKQSNWTKNKDKFQEATLGSADKKSLLGDASSLEKGDILHLVTNKTFKLDRMGEFGPERNGEHISKETINGKLNFIYLPKLANTKEQNVIKAQIAAWLGVDIIRAAEGYNKLYAAVTNVIDEIKDGKARLKGAVIDLDTFVGFHKKDVIFHTLSKINTFDPAIFKHYYFNSFRGLKEIEEQAADSIAATSTVNSRIKQIEGLMKGPLDNDFKEVLDEIKKDIK